MITLFQKAVGYLASDGNRESEVSCEPRPKLEDFMSDSEIDTKDFEGSITSIHDGIAVINHDMYFDTANSGHHRKFQCGDSVKGLAERRNKYEAWRIAKLELKQETWDEHGGKKNSCRNTKSQEGIGVFPKAGICSNLNSRFSSPKLNNSVSPTGRLSSAIKLINQDGDIRSETTRSGEQHSAVGKVTGMYHDNITVNGNSYFSVSSATCDFDLMEGDWISCKLASTPSTQHASGGPLFEGQLDVILVEPLRRRNLKGEISQVYRSHCIINNEIYCGSKTMQGGSVRVGDAVTVDVIESDQGTLFWRAVTLLPTVVLLSYQELGFQASSRHMLNFPSSEASLREDKAKQLLENKNGILISRSLRFPPVMLDGRSYIAAYVKNTNQEEKTLQRLYFVSTSQDSQFSITSCSAGGLLDGTPVNVDPNTGITVRLEFIGKYLGLAKQLCIFDFGNFQIGRYVSGVVEDQQMSYLLPNRPYVPQQNSKTFMDVQPKNDFAIKGQKRFKPPLFLARSLPHFNIPQYLWDAQVENSDILEVTPVLSEPLTPENHKEKFTVLLHLEEIELHRQMRQFDMSRASFSPHGEYLSLTVPGLAEKRPSLMIGDTVIASNPCNAGDVEYEGYIHEVLYTQVLLKFHPNFHNEYHGEDYSVRFNFNRTPLRRCHKALEFSMNKLSQDVLFPSKMKIQLPQVSYVDPEAPIICHSTSKVVNNKPLVVSAITRGADVKSTKTQLRAPSVASSAVKEEISQTLDLDCPSKVELDVNRTTCEPSRDFMNSVKNKGIYPIEAKNGFLRSTLSQDIDNESEGLKTDGVIDGARNVLLDGFKRQLSERNDKRVSEQLFYDINDRGKTKALASSLQVSAKENALDGKSCKADLNRNHCKGCNVSKCNLCKACNVKNCSPLRYDNGCDNTKENCNKIGLNVSPPRIPVVTRLFGIPSSGSTSSSSVSCSDEESKGNVSPDVKVQKRVVNSNRLVSVSHATKVEEDGAKCKNVQSSSEDVSVEKINCSSPKGVAYCQDKATDVKRSDNNENVSRSQRPSGKVLFLPRTLELNYYRNANTEKKSHDTEGMTTKKKTVKGNNAKPEPNENASVKKRHRTDNRLLERDPREKSRADERQRDGYYVPVLPIQTLKKKDMKSVQNLSHLPVLKWFNHKLNTEQKLAVRRILEGSTRPLPYIIYGPPGTGKTVTLVEAALQVSTLIPSSRLLIVTPSNSAADLITEHLVGSGQLSTADLVRLNAFQRLEDSISDSILPYCCNGDQLSVRIRQRVIVTTATTAGVLYTLGLHSYFFSHIFLDEAGQLTEPETLVALGLVNITSGQIVMAGDPEQLGPVVHSSLAKGYGLQQSLLHRLCYSVLYQPEETKTSAWVYEPRLVTQLVKNYRSHPDIIEVPSKLFYHDSLQAYAKTEVRDCMLKWGELPNPSCPLLFHGIIGENLQEGDSPSWFNPVEALQVVRYTKSLLIFGVMPQDIGIITPYRKQVEKIRKLLNTFGITEQVKVGSVEEFQGQERIAIIISTVRSSYDLLEVDVRHSLGFVKCCRRFNVAVTRAQSLLIVVGNPVLLSRDTNWLHLLNFCSSKGAYRGPEFNLMDSIMPS